MNYGGCGTVVGEVLHVNKSERTYFRRNVLPPLLGIASMITVVGVLNGQLLFAQLQYRLRSGFAETPATSQNTPSSNTVRKVANVAPSAAPSTRSAPRPALSAEPSVIIPSIKVDAPVIFEPSQESSKFQLALRRGVVNFPTTAKPGEPGNVVFFGHSSGQPWAPGDYKFVFTMLDRLKAGDKVYVNYHDVQYMYQVTSLEVVLPSDISVLNSTATPGLTLITCTPVGTSEKRLVVRAEQIIDAPPANQTPVVKHATVPAKKVATPQPDQLPDGERVSFWQSIRNLF